jgi:hypothetical protein
VRCRLRYTAQSGPRGNKTKRKSQASKTQQENSTTTPCQTKKFQFFDFSPSLCEEEEEEEEEEERRRMGVAVVGTDSLRERAAKMRESLQKSQTITDSVVSILGSFDHRLSVLETAMRPTQVHRLSFCLVH